MSCGPYGLERILHFTGIELPLFLVNDVPGAQVKEFCGFGTREECTRSNPNSACDKLHFKKIISKHTDGTLCQTSQIFRNCVEIFVGFQ